MARKIRIYSQRNKFPLDTLELGDLQAAYGEFVASFHTSNLCADSHASNSLSEALAAQIDSLRQLNTSLAARRQSLQCQTEISARRDEADRQLFDKQTISRQQLEQSEQDRLERAASLEQVDIELLRNQVLIREYERTWLELDWQHDEQGQQLWLALQSAYRRLAVALAEWEQAYVAVAPIDGAVSLHKYWGAGQFVNAGDEIMVIAPQNGRPISKVVLAQDSSGKIRAGQAVHVKLDGDRYSEFGIVTGMVVSEPRVMREGVYYLDIQLPHGLRTSHGEEPRAATRDGGQCGAHH